jgi:hypothetical protein
MDETMAEFTMLTGDEYQWNNIACCEATFRPVYADGTVGEGQTRSIIAASPDRARRILQVLMAGFGVVKILLYRLRGPLTPAQIARVHDLNAELRRIKSNGKDTD